jgi:hypothetical protein
MSRHQAPMPSAVGLAEPLRSRWSPARLGGPPHHEVMSGIAIGRRGAPDEVDERTRGREDRVRRRKQLAELVYADAWGAPWQRS